MFYFVAQKVNQHVMQGIVLSLTGIIGGIFLGFISDLYGIWNVMIPVAAGLDLTLFTMCTVLV